MRGSGPNLNSGVAPNATALKPANAMIRDNCRDEVSHVKPALIRFPPKQAAERTLRRRHKSIPPKPSAGRACRVVQRVDGYNRPSAIVRPVMPTGTRPYPVSCTRTILPRPQRDRSATVVKLTMEPQVFWRQT